MHLRSITLRGFKSFPDRTRLEFSRGVSVIVGPNGSGKSNITDAVLWALGEQSPLAVRGQSMQDVIFAGARGIQARAAAEVEVVLDNGDGAVDLPAGELSLLRRLERSGDGEYRLNGARCRLADVLEVLSDTGLGREMHSVVSQGRVEAIVTSKPRDRRLLIEEAAGLGKHRRRRRRAQLKLAKTQDNLDRALDVEREARTRLRPLKRQAEAAELHERLQRQSLEARWALARDAAGAARAAVAQAEAAALAARRAHAEVEAELAAVAARREAAERALAERSARREAIASRFYAARSAHERVGLRREAARGAASALADRLERRRALLAALLAEGEADAPDAAGAERVAALAAELRALDEDRQARLERELAELAAERERAAVEAERLAREADVRARERTEADARAEQARRERRAAERAADAARREAARVGGELAAVNQFLRAQAGAPGGEPALADGLRVDAGYELALAAALGSRLRAAVTPDLAAADRLLDRAGREGGAAVVAGPAPQADTASPPGAGEPRQSVPPPVAGAERLLDHVTGTDPELALVRRLLADAWLVPALDGLPTGFAGIAVTRSGRVWTAETSELRQVPAGGEDRVLGERNRRDRLVAEAERAAQAEQAALAAVAQAGEAVAAADAARDEAERSARDALRARDQARETERHAGWVMERRRKAPDAGPSALKRAQVEAELAAERRLAERARRERAERAQRIAHARERIAADERLAPAADRLAAVLADAHEAVAARLAEQESELAARRAEGEQVAAEMRACALAEADVQGRLRHSSEAVTRAEVRAQQARDRAAEVDAELGSVADRLGLAAEPAEEPLPDDDRETLRARLERLARRREQLGPVNPLAGDEYAEAVAHVEELERQREDLETALRELQTLIRDTDRKIRESFEATFAAASAAFEEVVPELFPGGRGRLRLVRPDAGPRPVLGGQEVGEEEPSGAAAAEDAGEDLGQPDEDELGVEIEVMPAGKAAKRLSLLSGGEKSLTALAFLFAVFLARPCPFYILDEVEAALDDVNIDRFLSLLRRYSDRAQFIVVTHQKRTMEAADCLYGVSMGGDGVSKVVSRRLPPERPAVAAGAA